jgi:hypothetical protein
MDQLNNPQKIIRSLYIWEIAQANIIFGDTLQYEKVRIHEYARWPNVIDDIGRKLKNEAPRGEGVSNAITLCNHCYFPVGLPIYQPEPPNPEIYKTSWLIHELTHCWQYQRLGIKYLFMALQAQFKLGPEAYIIGKAQDLIEKHQHGWRFVDFNIEQQARLNETFYIAINNLPSQQDMHDACLLYIVEEKSMTLYV